MPKLFLFLLLLLWSFPAALSQDAPANLRWTKTQDLNPNAAPSNTPIKQKWAVVIGVGRYKEPRLNNEERPDEGAEEFYEYLIDEHGGRFDPQHVKLLVNHEATQQGIAAALGKDWAGGLAGPDDLVVVYVATNSFPTTDGNTYLCTYNTALDNVYSTCLSMRTLMDMLKKNIKAGRIVLVLQSSYSGAVDLGSGAKAAFKSYNMNPAQMSLGKGYVLVSSSQPDQMSWGNIFTSNFVKSLREKDGLIALPDAFEKARDLTRQETTNQPGKRVQTPVMKSEWRGQDIVLGVPPLQQGPIPEAVTKHLGAESHYLKANQFVEAGKQQEAAAEYEQAISTDPHYADALADYGALLALKSDWQKSAEMYKRALAENTNDPLFHANYARVLNRLGDADECKKELETAYQLNRKDRNVLVALSDRCLKVGESDRSVVLLREALELFPQDSSLHNRLSQALAERGDLDDSVVEAQEAVKLDPNSLPSRLNLASVLLLNGNAKEAISTYREAITLSPQNADGHYLLGKALDSFGDSSGARQELKKFLELCSTNDQRAISAKQRLEELSSK
jgi:Flp pilus assembly protein TadD